MTLSFGIYLREEGVCQDGEVGEATDGAQRVRQGGGALPAALGKGEERELRGGELWLLV